MDPVLRTSTVGLCPGFVPVASTFERPRGTRRYGTRNGSNPEPDVVGVAITTPRTVCTRAPKLDATAGGSAATSAADSVTVTVSVFEPCAGTATGSSENVTSAPSWLPTAATDRSNVASVELVLLIVSGCDSVYAP